MSDAIEAGEGLLVSPDMASGTQLGDTDPGAVPGGQSAGSGWDTAPPVQIRVAIEAAEDDGDHESLDFRGGVEGGSCSEDDYSRGDKYSGAATSGGENDGDEPDQNWKPPDPDLLQKLLVQIEYYLSDENLEKDAFLLKHVRRNKMGFVSVKLLTSFKKVKHLTRDWRTTAYALRYSDILELNEDHRKIRRKIPVPVFPSENLPSKMLLVYDLHFIPELHCLAKEQENGGMQEKVMEQLLKTFRVFGVISSIRILKPGRDLPSDVKRFSSRYSQVGTKDCAIVEFEEVDAAIKAHETLNVESDTDDGLKVILIGMKPPKKKIQKDRSKDEDSNNVRKGKSLNKRVEELQYVSDEPATYSSSEPDSNPNSPIVGRKIHSANKLSPSAYPNNHLSPNASPRNSPWSSPCGQRKGVKQSPLADSMSPELFRKCTEYSSDSSVTPSGSPWVQRRRQAQTVTQEKSPACSPMLGRKVQNADGLPPGVLRLPRGPDGTKGFHNGAERNRPVQC
ncbi:la-related protein 6-like [Rhinophrynus dorsalis]